MVPSGDWKWSLTYGASPSFFIVELWRFVSSRGMWRVFSWTCHYYWCTYLTRSRSQRPHSSVPLPIHRVHTEGSKHSWLFTDSTSIIGWCCIRSSIQICWRKWCHFCWWYRPNCRRLWRLGTSKFFPSVFPPFYNFYSIIFINKMIL